MKDAGGARRLVQLDALRGVAAMSVVLFHFTTRFGELYHPAQPPWVSFPHGHYGVDLFFMISGFVICMTLHRTRVGMDFVVSRFSRLYPAYWAAIALTVGVTHLLGLPGRESGAGTALLNGLMFHGLFGVPDVDGAYWTLLIELQFYAWMFLLFRLGRLDQVHLWMLGLLVARGLSDLADQHWGVSLPWKVYMVLILKYLPWFALGVAVYSEVEAGRTGRRLPGVRASAVAAVLVLVLTETPLHGLLAAALLALLHAAARQRLAWLEWRPLVWLGGISYTLYLLHEYIGWSLLLAFGRQGVDRHLALALTLAIVLLMAHAVTVTVERPAMNRIRRAWRERQAAGALREAE